MEQKRASISVKITGLQVLSAFNGEQSKYYMYFLQLNASAIEYSPNTLFHKIRKPGAPILFKGSPLAAVSMQEELGIGRNSVGLYAFIR